MYAVMSMFPFKELALLQEILFTPKSHFSKIPFRQFALHVLRLSQVQYLKFMLNEYALTPSCIRNHSYSTSCSVTQMSFHAAFSASMQLKAKLKPAHALSGMRCTQH